MQTLLFGHIPVLSQMTEVHAGFLTMKRSVSECMYIIMLQEKYAIVQTQIILIVKSLKGSSVMPVLHMHNFESISAAVEDTHKTMLFTHIEKCVCTCS